VFNNLPVFISAVAISIRVIFGLMYCEVILVMYRVFCVSSREIYCIRTVADCCHVTHGFCDDVQERLVNVS